MGGGAESLTAISHSVSGVPYHTTKEKCAMSGIFEGVVKCRKEKGRLAPARKCSIVYILYLWLRISWDVLWQLMVMVFDLIMKLHSVGGLLKKIFFVKLAHTKHHNGPFFHFLPRSRTKRAPNFGLESLLLSKISQWSASFFANWWLRCCYSQWCGKQMVRRVLPACLPITCQLRTIWRFAPPLNKTYLLLLNLSLNQ